MLLEANAQRLPLPKNSVDLIFTDPPYLHQYLQCYRWLALEAARVLKPGGFVLAMCGNSYINRIFRFFDAAGLNFYWKYELFMAGQELAQVWPYRNQKVSVRVHSKPILAYSKGPALPPASTESAIWSSRPDKRFHHWGQNISSAKYVIEHFSLAGDVVLDPFVGGGTTAVACALLGRRWIGSDLDRQALQTTQKRLASKRQ